MKDQAQPSTRQEPGSNSLGEPLVSRVIDRLFSEQPKEKVEAMAKEIFSHFLSGDLKFLLAERVSSRQDRRPTLGTLHPELAKLQGQLLREELGGGPQSREEAVVSYLKYRQKYLAGARDEYGRPGFLHSVPSQHDSAATVILAELEFEGLPLIEEGPMYKIYEGRQSDRKPRLFTRLSFWTDDVDEGKEIPTINGIKIVVPSSGFAGYYATLFIPEDGSDRLSLRVYSPDSTPFEEEFSTEVARTLYEVIQKGELTPEDMAAFYAIKIYAEKYGKIEQIQTLIAKGMKRYDAPAPTVEDLAGFFAAISNFPQQFKPAEMTSSNMNKNLFAQLEDSFPKEDPHFELKVAQAILFESEVHNLDPVLTVYALNTLANEENYAIWFAYNYRGLENSRVAAMTIEEPTLEIARDHSERYRRFAHLDRIKIPWQARHLLRSDQIGQFRQGLKKIDPNSVHFMRVIDDEESNEDWFMRMSTEPISLLGSLPRSELPEGILQEVPSSPIISLKLLHSAYLDLINQMYSKIDIKRANADCY